MNAIRILIADDHQIVRVGIRTILESQPDFEIVGESGDGYEAIRLTRELIPDVIILDLMMPGLNGIEVLQKIHPKFPSIRIVILSMHDNEAYIVEVMRSGASAFVLKQSTSEDLVTAIRSSLAGKRYLSPSLSERVIDSYIKFIQIAQIGERDPYEILTPREQGLFTLTAQGHSNSEIAAILTLSTRTVETHRANLMHKLGLRTQVDLVRFAMEKGILLK